MAFAALISLSNTIEQNLHHPLIPDKQQIEALLQEATFFQNFLENSLHKCDDKVERLESQIRDVAYRAADIIELHLVDELLSKSATYAVENSTTFNQALEKVIEEIHFIKQEVMTIEDEIVMQDLQPRTSLGTVSSKPTLSGESTMVGLDDELEEIRTRLITGSSKLQILSILGMGGIGKTTMARNMYDDLSIKDHFYIRGWVTISQEYNDRKIILDILDSMKMLPHNMREESIDKLKGLLHKTLSLTRYLIVLDDVWDKKAWDDVKLLFSNDNNGSRIILTTRLKEVADHANSCPPLHQVRFLNNVESWKLFCDTVFGREGCCPPELDEIGKQISQNCRGLPLSIVVIGGLLSKDIKTEYYWRNILANLNSTITSSDEQCLKVLSLSYKCLPHHLKGCLLYMGIFPEDSEVSVFELVNLWVVEGILKPIRSKSFEDVAEEYLLDLVERNLVLGGKKNSMGKIKTCKIHDLLRDLCVRQSKKEMFFHSTYPNLLNMSKGIASPRIVLPYDVKLDPDQAETLSSFLPRSFLFFSREKLPDTIESSNFRLVRIFHKDYDLFSFSMSFAWEQLVSLRYLNIPIFLKFDVLASLYKLRHLQTLIITHRGMDWSYMNSKIWEMQELRHVVIKPTILLDPPARSENERENSIIVLENLQTLTMIENFRCTEEVLKRIPNLKKLGVSCRWSSVSTSEDMNDFVGLHKLEELTYKGYKLKNLSVPRSLKKLTLIDGPCSSGEMKMIGSLPNLQVLKIKRRMFYGLMWKLEGEGFLQLKVLLLDKVLLKELIADSIHFPKLQRLVIKNCKDLKIPIGIGEILTLQSIELFRCGRSVITAAKQIQKEQENLGNDSLRVLIIDEYQ